MDQGSRLLRIGIFYDGNYFYHVSNYYCYAHQRRSRLSIPGLHDFIKRMVSEKEGIDERLCQIVDCHYFRGRLQAMEANARQILLNERVFDDILMREGVVTHYLPLNHGTEKGVDVSLALETLELSIFKHFNVVVLIASDGDYVPLVRKLNSLGTRVMVLAWNFEYMDDNGNLRYTSTSSKLLNEVSYPLLMHKIIDGECPLDNFSVDTLFVNGGGNDRTQGTDKTPSGPDRNPENAEPVAPPPTPEEPVPAPNRKRNDQTICCGRIVQMKNGYGFISMENSQKNLFFFWEDLENCDFNQLQIGDLLEFEIGSNERGDCARHINRMD